MHPNKSKIQSALSSVVLLLLVRLIVVTSGSSSSITVFQNICVFIVVLDHSVKKAIESKPSEHEQVSLDID
jgi:hypothetical protein